MIEVTGDMWEYNANIKLITTNGFVKRNGEAVMGRGCALEFARRYPDAKATLGQRLQDFGNQVNFLFYRDGVDYYSFPVKHNWWEVADLELIRQSTLEMADILTEVYFEEEVKVLLPRPGCGNGQRDWDTEVKPLLNSIIGEDDRWHIITKEV